MRTTTPLVGRAGPRRLLRGDALWWTVWSAAAVVVEVAGRRMASAWGDALLLAGLTVLGLATWRSHGRQPLAVGRLFSAGRRRVRAFVRSFRYEMGVDLRPHPPLLPGTPRAPWRAVVAAGVLACATAVASPLFPGALRSTGLATSYFLYLAVLAALWGLCAFAATGSLLMTLAVLLDHMLGRAADRGAAPRFVAERLFAFAAVLAVSAVLLPAAWAHRALIGIVVVSCLLPLFSGSAHLTLVWRAAGGPQRSLGWSTERVIEMLVVALPALTLVHLTAGADVAGMPGATRAVDPTRVLGVLVCWTTAACFAAMFLLSVRFAVMARFHNPARPVAPSVHLDAPCPATAVRALRDAGFVVRTAGEPPRREDVRVGVDPDELALPRVHAMLRRRHEIVQRRLLRRGLESLFKTAARLEYRRGEGYWVAPHLWFVPRLARDTDEDDRGMQLGIVEQVMGPTYRRVIPMAARHHAHRVLEAAQVDLIFVEDGVPLRSLRRVFAVLYEVYDVHGGRRAVQERDFSRLPGLRVVIHEFGLENPFDAGRYPEPDYEGLGRARVLHVFRDRGGEEHEVDVESPRSRVPLAC